MEMHVPAVPLITVDPYFSVWTRQQLTGSFPTHWTGKRNAIRGTVTVDDQEFLFWGQGPQRPMQQVSLDMDALSTTVIWENEAIRLSARFVSPLLADDLYYASRPVVYLHVSYEPLDGASHHVRVKVSCSEELVLNTAGEGRAWSKEEPMDGITCLRMGNGTQNVLWRNGDDVRIDWGYLYLAVNGRAVCGNEVFQNLYAIYAEQELTPQALFVLAYDDIYSIEYFGKPLEAYWKKRGKSMVEVISEAFAEFDTLAARCTAFSETLYQTALQKGGRHYAELLVLAYRQVMAAHKLVVDEDGNNLYISKECFSNACAATVDVTYPSAPMFLLYNTELLKGMLRPIFRFARSELWSFDFAPHDAGRYPLVNGQWYGSRLEDQMPVEECGNLLILAAAICDRENDTQFAEEHLDLLEQWSAYLVSYGEDPAHQLCTDDFAGHLSHNCNLSIKAIMGLAGYARILQRLGQQEKADSLREISERYAASFLKRAANDDGSSRLAYPLFATFSLKYNAVWDKLWQTHLFPDRFFAGEIARYKREALPYGVPLDSRETYTKSDWTLWAACLADNRADFEFFVDRLWNAYHHMHHYAPMTDWYYADTAEYCGFQHRSVQGGLFLKLLFA